MLIRVHSHKQTDAHRGKRIKRCTRSQFASVKLDCKLIFPFSFISSLSLGFFCGSLLYAFLFSCLLAHLNGSPRQMNPFGGGSRILSHLNEQRIFPFFLSFSFPVWLSEINIRIYVCLLPQSDIVLKVAYSENVLAPKPLCALSDGSFA